MNDCPRCGAPAAECREELQGHHNGQVLWRIRHCTRCSFTWRDSEPARSIDAAQRDRFFQIDPANPDLFPYNIPPPGARR